MKNILFLLFSVFILTNTKAQNYNLLVGTYTNTGTSKGIYVYNFNSLTAETKIKNAIKTDNPSYLAVSKDNKFVYSVNETGKTSEVSSFSFNAKSGEMVLLNKKSAEGADPCFILLDEKNVIVANYSGGNIAVFGRNTDSSLTAVKQVVQHTGKSIDPKKRQESAHVHQVQFSPDKKYLICNDLGEDQIYIYNYNPKGHNEILTIKKIIKTNAGSGPRHLAFSPSGKFAYLAHEFNGSITVFKYAEGTLTKLQEIGTTSKNFIGNIDGADIHVSPDGRFLYETNRGDANTITVFAITKKGFLQHIETLKTLGKGPRNFAIDPTGKFLLVAHQYTNDIVIFNRNADTGKLTNSGKKIDIGAPVCLVFNP